MKDGCGFLFVRYKRHFCTELISWEHVACPLFGIKRRPLMGGWLNTSCIVFSIRAIASVRYREVVRSWEGPLWEVPLYWMCCSGAIRLLWPHLQSLSLHVLPTTPIPSLPQACSPCPPSSSTWCLGWVSSLSLP